MSAIRPLWFSSQTNPLPNGTASPGSQFSVAGEGHVHPESAVPLSSDFDNLAYTVGGSGSGYVLAAGTVVDSGGAAVPSAAIFLNFSNSALGAIFALTASVGSVLNIASVNGLSTAVIKCDASGNFAIRIDVPPALYGTNLNMALLSGNATAQHTFAIPS